MFNNLTVRTIYIILGIFVLLLLMLGAFGLGHFRRLRRYNYQNKPVWLWISIASIVLMLASCFGIYNIHHSARTYGANCEHYTKLKYSQFKYDKNNSPKVKIPKQGQKNIIIVVYRFTCPDCHRIYPQMIMHLPENSSKVYYVPSRSAYGWHLVKSQYIQTVPTIVYVNKNGQKEHASLINHKKQINVPVLKAYKHMAGLK